jgi:SpoVK/Ycf46/Vps4 family AAA+-type ATPase
MEQLVNVLVGYILIAYLPVADVGFRLGISVAISGIITRLLCSIWEWAKTLNVIEYLFASKKSYVTIDPENPMYDKLLGHIYDKYHLLLKGCTLETDVGKNKLMATKFKNTSIKEDYILDGQTHQIQFVFDTNTKETEEDDKKKEKKESKKTNIIIESDSNIKVIESYLNIFIQSIPNKVSNKIPIYRTEIMNKKDVFSQDVKWKCTITKLSKNMHNTIVSDAVKKNFYTDIENFINSEDFYLEKGLPYKRGYILYGEPGCGKTSLIKAIANQYQLPIFIIDLNMIYSNAELIKITNDISSHLLDDQKYLVVYEDIDRSKLIRWGDDNRVSVDCFLNVLDGVDEYYGRITILTANDYDKLSKISALIRPGRIDVIVEICFCTIKQIEQILKFYFTGIQDFILNPSIIITPAQLLQLILMVKDIEKIVWVLNKHKNFSKINMEKVTSIYHEAKIEELEADKIEPSELDIHDKSEESDKNETHYDKMLNKMIDRLSTYDLKIKQYEGNLDALSIKNKITYDKLILNRKSLELQISDMKKRAELREHKKNLLLKNEKKKKL